MKLGITDSINFAVGLTFTVFGFITMFKTESFSILIIAIIIAIIGLSRLAKSQFVIAK